MANQEPTNRGNYQSHTFSVEERKEVARKALDDSVKSAAVYSISQFGRAPSAPTIRRWRNKVKLA